MSWVFTQIIRVVHGVSNTRNAVRQSLFWSLLMRQRKWVIWVLWMFVANVSVQIYIANLTRAMVDTAIVDHANHLWPYVKAIAQMGVWGMVFGFAAAQLTQRVSYQLEFDMRTWLYTRVQSAELSRLNSVASGQLVTRALTDLQLLERLLSLFPILIGLLPVMLGITVFVAFLSPLMAAISVLALPVNIWILRLFRTRLWALSWAELNERAEVMSAIAEPVRGVRVVKAFAREEEERSKVAAAALKVYRFALSRVRLLARYDFFMKLVPFIVQGVALGTGAHLLAANRLTLGTFLIAFQLVGGITTVAAIFDEIASAWQYLRSAQLRLAEMLALGSRPLLGGATLSAPGEGLQLQNATVRFDGRAVLDRLSLVAGPGQLVVVTGPPGSGKSTLARLIIGMEAPSDGVVTLDGRAFDELEPAELRRSLRVVSEESVLFATTLRENLLLGAGGSAAQEAIDRALWAAAAEDVVAELPGGLDDDVGDRGLTLSGGQRQRLALARALVAPPRVLVLDDAMAAVNPSLEVEILRRIQAHAPLTSIICITRRPGPAMIADQVLELPPPPPELVHEAAPAADGMAESALGRAVGALRVTSEAPKVPEALVLDDRPPRARQLAGPFKGLIAIVLVVLSVQTIAKLAPDYLFGEIADVVEGGNTSGATWRALLMVFFGFLLAASAYLFRVFVQRYVQGVIYMLRRRVFQRLTRLGIDFYDREVPGHVAARVVYDLDIMLNFLTGPAFLFFSQLATFLIGMTVIATLSAEVLPIVAAMAAVILAISVVQFFVAKRAYGWSRDELGRVTAKFEEDFGARHEIRNLGAGAVQTRKFVEVSWHRRHARRWVATVTNLYAALIQYLGLMTATLVLWRAGDSVLAGSLTIGTALTLRLLATSATQPLQQIGQTYTQFLELAVSWNRLCQPFGAPLLPETRPDSRAAAELRGDVEFDNVKFAYPHTGREVLHGVSFAIPSGTTVALVGYTGAGKSSIAKLLTRTYDPDSGAVRIDGIDIRDLHLESYRRRLGVVPQDPFVFKGTVASNLGYGRTDATEADMLAALEAVGAGSLLDVLPDGLHQRVEEEGRNLTAAQRQLIALARAWIARPDVLVLDEATSSLDAPVERAVLDALAKLQVTTLMITHRDTVVSYADEVIVLDAGRVVETGTVSDVVGAGGPYDRLWVTEELLAAVPAGAGPAGRRGRRRTPRPSTGTRPGVAANGSRRRDRRPPQ